MKLLARVGGEEGSGTKAVDKIGAPVSPLSVAFFRFLARDFLLEFLGDGAQGDDDRGGCCRIIWAIELLDKNK